MEEGSTALTLTRNVGGRIRLVIPGAPPVVVWLEVVETKGAAVRLRIEAPPGVMILRAELIEGSADGTYPKRP